MSGPYANPQEGECLDAVEVMDSMVKAPKIGKTGRSECRKPDVVAELGRKATPSTEKKKRGGRETGRKTGQGASGAGPQRAGGTRTSVTGETNS